METYNELEYQSNAELALSEENPYLHDETINMGDLNVFGRLDENGRLMPLDRKRVRKDTINRATMETTVYSGDLVDRSNPKRNYGCFWWRKGHQEHLIEEFDRLVDLGYRRAKATDFWVRRWHRDAAGNICTSGRILMVIPEERWIQNQREKLQFMDRELDISNDKLAAEASRIDPGVEFVEIRAGEEVERTRGKRTKS